MSSEPHSVKERFEKIKCLFDTIDQIENQLLSQLDVNPSFLVHQIESLKQLSDEARRCLDSLRYEVF